jgi:hypothetical protein
MKLKYQILIISSLSFFCGGLCSTLLATNSVVVKHTVALPTVETNWTQIGTFTQAGPGGKTYQVLEGHTVTNFNTVIESEGQQWTILVKSTTGPTNDTWRLVPMSPEFPTIQKRMRE